ncbi:hypothetical protein FisN_19Lh128 [Fistulifera solaris]|uniref:HSF-type DNA-binding domain-containing protein n=1 Tax=Fistulifera solaris TaxID=1519565 RepID=A0A1Z5J797_FISSO|nr:hypothetical protein FisN_19Lh128 [Fistulifera solaris]|eukprot:GAX09661.1 hypothetical protein FisN_19Lh128 [Fistulifera solaris]
MDIRNNISAELSALLNRNAGMLPVQSYLGLGGSESLGLSSANPNMSSILASLVLQQQAEERQKALLIHQLALLGADSNGLASLAARSPVDALALLLQRQQPQNFPIENSSLDRLAALRAATIPDPGVGVSSLPNHAGDLANVLQAQHLREQQDSGSILHKATPAEIKRKGRSGSFPQKLHQILQELERQEGGREIASFLPHGKAFAIHKPRDFVKTIMPKYFRMSRFSSFQRQLNLYDFQRITEGRGKGAYYHDLFVKDKPMLASMMKRNKIKGVKNQDDISHDDEEEDEEKKI